MRFGLALILLCVAGFAQAQDNKEERQVPRFAFTKSDLVNLRQGPTKDHEVAFIYKQAGLPVEITAEYDNWRRIRDWEGTEGWVQNTLLTGGKRQVMVLPAKEGLVPVYSKAANDTKITAKLEAKVMAIVKTCDTRYCLVQHKDFEGYIAQNRLWGVYPNEKF